MNIDNLIDLAKNAALEAGAAILEVYQSDSFDVEAKDDDSPLTRADKAAHEVIKKHLEETGLPILSEEGRAIDFTEREAWKMFWMVDPLDGTKEFIKKNGEFTVNIALIENNVPIGGVVYAPVLDWLYWAIPETGAFKQIGKGKPVAIQSSAATLSDQSLRVVASRSHLNGETQAFIDQLATPELVSMGSSLKILLVAEGKADVYPRFAPTMEWDTAAADAIVRNSRGCVFQKDLKTPLLYNKVDLLNPHFVVKGNY